MGIKLGSIVIAIIFLFIAKISLEATTTTVTHQRSPSSLSAANSIDEDYINHMKGDQLKH